MLDRLTNKLLAALRNLDCTIENRFDVSGGQCGSIRIKIETPEYRAMIRNDASGEWAWRVENWDGRSWAAWDESVLIEDEFRTRGDLELCVDECCRWFVDMMAAVE